VTPGPTCIYRLVYTDLYLHGGGCIYRDMSKLINFRLSVEDVAALDRRGLPNRTAAIKQAIHAGTEQANEVIDAAHLELHQTLAARLPCARCPKREAEIEKLAGQIEKLKLRLASAEESGSASSFGGGSEKKAAREERQKARAGIAGGFLARSGPTKLCEHGARPDLCRKEKCRT